MPHQTLETYKETEGKGLGLLMLFRNAKFHVFLFKIILKSSIFSFQIKKNSLNNEAFQTLQIKRMSHHTIYFDQRKKLNNIKANTDFGIAHVLCPLPKSFLNHGGLGKSLTNSRLQNRYRCTLLLCS